MFMKHYAPNRCEPSIEVIVKMGVRQGEGVGWKPVGGRGVRVVVKQELTPGRSGRGIRAGGG